MGNLKFFSIFKDNNAMNIILKNGILTLNTGPITLSCFLTIENGN